MNELEGDTECVISDEEKMTYAGLYILKKMDLKLKKQPGGAEFPIKLPAEIYPLDDVLQHLALNGYVEMKKDNWVITKKGLAYLGEHIDEAKDLIEEFDHDDIEVEDMIAELEERNLDPFRARFLWAWVDGEIDDLTLYQERRGVKPVERMWGFYLMSNEFWNDLARELDVGEDDEDDN